MERDEPTVVRAGAWVRVHRTVLEPRDRAPGIPHDTASVPFEAWVNGWLAEDATLGGAATVRTPSGRLVDGTLVEVGPGYRHTFGSPPGPLHVSGQRAREVVFGRERG